VRKKPIKHGNKNIIMYRESMYAIITGILIASCNSSNYERRDKADDTVTGQIKIKGYVPDESTAKRIAEAVWCPIYGSSVLNEKPYKAKIIGDSVWVVEGSLPSNQVGGTAYIEIRAADCKVLNVTHGK